MGFLKSNVTVGGGVRDWIRAIQGSRSGKLLIQLKADGPGVSKLEIQRSIFRSLLVEHDEQVLVNAQSIQDLLRDWEDVKSVYPESKEPKLLDPLAVIIPFWGENGASEAILYGHGNWGQTRASAEMVVRGDEIVAHRYRVSKFLVGLDSLVEAVQRGYRDRTFNLKNLVRGLVTDMSHVLSDRVVKWRVPGFQGHLIPIQSFLPEDGGLLDCEFGLSPRVAKALGMKAGEWYAVWRHPKVFFNSIAILRLAIVPGLGEVIGATKDTIVAKFKGDSDGDTAQLWSEPVQIEKIPDWYWALQGHNPKNVPELSTFPIVQRLEFSCDLPIAAATTVNSTPDEVLFGKLVRLGVGRVTTALWDFCRARVLIGMRDEEPMETIITDVAKITDFFAWTLEKIFDARKTPGDTGLDVKDLLKHLSEPYGKRGEMAEQLMKEKLLELSSEMNPDAVNDLRKRLVAPRDIAEASPIYKSLIKDRKNDLKSGELLFFLQRAIRTEAGYGPVHPGKVVEFILNDLIPNLKERF